MPTGGPRKQFSRTGTQVQSFADHANCPATLVFRSDTSLPPLYGFSLYFTHPELDCQTIDHRALFDGLVRRSTLQWRNVPGCPIHLKVYFLPDADEKACVVHYNREVEKNGYYSTQIAAFEKEAPSLDSEETAQGPLVQFDNEQHPTLPGHVHSYINDHTIDFHHGVLFMLLETDWNAENVRRVVFDPVDQEVYGRHRQEDDPEHVAGIVSHPMFLFDDNEFGWYPSLGNVIADLSHLRTANETNGIWEKARELGLGSWPVASM